MPQTIIRNTKYPSATSAWFVLFLLIFCAGQVYSQNPVATPTPADSDEVVKISTSLVQVDVTIVDSRGRVVKDIRPEEIEIYENGRKQQISNFSLISVNRPANTAPAKEVRKNNRGLEIPEPTKVLREGQVRRTIALVVDDLSVSFENAPNIRRSLRTFVDEQMGEGDLVAILRTGAGTGALQQFTSDKSILYAAIDRVKWNPRGNKGTSAFAPLRPTFSEMVEAEGYGVASDVDESFNASEANAMAIGTRGALRYIIGGMAELPGRKSIILMSEGWRLFDKSREGNFSQSNRFDTELGRLIEAANRASIVIYPLDVRGVVYTGITAADQLTTGNAAGGTPVPSPQRMAAVQANRKEALELSRDGMRTLAQETGGSAIFDTNDLAGGVRKILEDQSYYLIAYEPDSDTFDPEKRKFNSLDIKVLRSGVTVRHRQGFMNVAEESIAKRGVSDKASPSEQLKHALMSPFAVNELSLRLNALFGSAPQGDFVRSMLHVKGEDLKFSDAANGRKKAAFEVWAASFDDNGAIVEQIRKTYALTVKPENYKKIMDSGFTYFFIFPVKKPGPYQYRVAIRDTQSGKVGSASEFVQVPDLKKGRLSTSGIMLESLTSQAWAKLMDANAPVEASNSSEDTAIRKIRLGTVLRYGFDVYNAKLGAGQRPSLQSRIRVFLDGKMILDGPEIPVDLTGQNDMKHIAVNGAMNIGDKMQVGSYILQIVVTDTLANQKQQIATEQVEFEVVP